MCEAEVVLPQVKDANLTLQNSCFCLLQSKSRHMHEAWQLGEFSTSAGSDELESRANYEADECGLGVLTSLHVCNHSNAEHHATPHSAVIRVCSLPVAGGVLTVGC